MRPSLNLDLPNPEWLDLLHAEHEKGKSIAEIAREIGVPRPSVSMLLNGTYPAKSLDLFTRKHGARIVELYRNRVLCPFHNRSLTKDECHRLAGAPMSTSHPDKLRQWGACRNCALNPLKGDKNE